MLRIHTMNIEELDWLDCSLFLMLASAEITDNYLTEEEINSILEKAQGLTLMFPSYHYSRDIIIEKFNKAFEWYNWIGDSAPKNKMNDHLMKKIFELTSYMKIQLWFNNEFSQNLLNDLVAIAHADGEIIKNEQRLINRIAEDWNLTKPFS